MSLHLFETKELSLSNKFSYPLQPDGVNLIIRSNRTFFNWDKDDEIIVYPIFKNTMKEFDNYSEVFAAEHYVTRWIGYEFFLIT